MSNVKCQVCAKTVYAMEKVSVEGKSFHENCFKCAQCKKKLSPGTYTALENTYYCKPHYTQLFTTKGNYSEGFGKEKPTSGWAPQTGSFEGHDTKSQNATQQPQASAPASKGPPVPPPAPPPLVDTPAPDEGDSQANAHAAALAEITSGGLTGKLKHVSKEDRKKKPESSVVPDKPKPTRETATRDTGVVVKKGTPELKLENGKWNVKFFEGRQEDPIEVKITDIKQSVVITDCSKSVVVVKGKLTNISVMNCIGCAVVFDDIIAAVEIVRSQKVQVQANGQIAQIIVDKTNGIDIFIQSEIGKSVEIVSSLSDAMNINYPGATPDDDPIEFPIPNQYNSVIQGGVLKTTPVEHV